MHIKNDYKYQSIAFTCMSVSCKDLHWRIALGTSVVHIDNLLVQNYPCLQAGPCGFGDGNSFFVVPMVTCACININLCFSICIKILLNDNNLYLCIHNI